jgi:polar amino acid transport system substrate-binding protein
MKRKLFTYAFAMILVAMLIPGSAFGDQTMAERDRELFKNIQKEGVLKVGAASTPPKFFQNTKGQWVGVFRDFFEDFAEELGVKLEVVGTTWEYIIAGLKAGKYDLAPNMNITVKRTLSIKFSSPTHNPEINFMYMKGSKIPQKEFYTLEELDRPDFTVAVMSGSAQHHIIKSKVKHLKILPVPGTPECWMAVQAGRADFTTGWTPESAQFVAKNPEKAAIGWFKPQVAKTSSGIGVRRTVSNESLQVLNTMITNTKLDGRMYDWYYKYSELPKGYSLDRLLWPR